MHTYDVRRYQGENKLVKDGFILEKHVALTGILRWFRKAHPSEQEPNRKALTMRN